MFENYDVSKLLDSDGKFPLLEEQPSELLTGFDLSRSKISSIVNRYYQNNISRLDKKGSRISTKVSGNQKQLLQDTISDLSQQYPMVSQLRGFLMDTAALESSYKLNSTSKASTASGWFGFLDSTKKTILKQLGVNATREQFNKNPKLQVLAATQLYYNIIKQANNQGVLQAAALRGFTQDEVVHAYWLNPTWAKNYFLYGKEGGADAFGTTVPKYIKKIRGIK